jgi:hypothetical protein
LWSKEGAVGNAQALSTASPPVRRRRIVHKSTASARLRQDSSIDTWDARRKAFDPVTEQGASCRSYPQPERLPERGSGLPARSSHICKDGYE